MHQNITTFISHHYPINLSKFWMKFVSIVTVQCLFSLSAPVLKQRKGTKAVDGQERSAIFGKVIHLVSKGLELPETTQCDRVNHSRAYVAI